MTNLEKKIFLITGATDGIGKQTAIDLAILNARVIVHGRSEASVSAAADEIRKESGKSEIETIAADLASIRDIQQMAAELGQRFQKIDCLINNAGVLKNERELSKDGFELTFAVNHISYFLLTGMLLDMLRKSDYARIVNVASQAHAHLLDFDNLQGEKFYDDYDAYSRSKLCNILFTYRLSEFLQEGHLTVNALHPGVISTKLLHAGWGSGGADVSQGSATSVYLATSSDVKNSSGKYYAGMRELRSASISYDKSVQDKLWHVSEELTGFSFGFDRH